MRTLFQDEARAQLIHRVGALTPDRVALWGKFSCPKMLAHVNDQLRMALGELPTVLRRTPLRYPVLKQLVVYVLPFPKGVPTSPELLARSPGAWAAEVTAFGQLVARFPARREQRQWPVHPAFGPLSGHAWGVLSYRHAEHHLRQFGV
jgi:hypothetical protein